MSDRAPETPEELDRILCRALCGDASECSTLHHAVREAQAAALRSYGAAREAEARAAKDAAYAERNQVVALLARMALALGWRAGIGVHEDKPGEAWEPDWRTLLCIDLPTGQASWHFHDSHRHLLDGLPEYRAGWDGHDTPEKYRRVSRALATPPGKEAPCAHGVSHWETCPACVASFNEHAGPAEAREK
jgi:hypothetical protein